MANDEDRKKRAAAAEELARVMAAAGDDRDKQIEAVSAHLAKKRAEKDGQKDFVLSAEQVDSSPGMLSIVLRWIAVIPGSIAAVFLVMFPVHWFLVLMVSFVPEDDLSLWNIFSLDTMEHLAIAFVTPFTMIRTGSFIAPSHKFETSIGMAIVWGVLFGITMTLTASYITAISWPQTIAATILAITGVIVALVKTYRETNNEAT